MDSITINNLELWTHLGVPEEERKKEQRVLVSVQAEVNTKRTADDKMDVNYEPLYKSIKEVAKLERKTIEKLAEDIADVIMQHTNVQCITVAVSKFILPGTDFVSIKITKP